MPDIPLGSSDKSKNKRDKIVCPHVAYTVMVEGRYSAVNVTNK